MANVQLENGYTKIANELLEVLSLARINGTQFRIIMVILRYTYGFNRTVHKMSETFIAKATGIHKQQIKRELNRLIELKIVEVVKEATFTTSRVIKFSKDYELWKKESIQEIKKDAGSGLDTPTGSLLDTTTGSGLDTQEINIKKNTKENIYSATELEILEYWNSKDIIKHYQTTEMQKSIQTALRKFKKEKVIEAITNYATIFHDESYFYSHIWRLDKFLKQSNGIADFLNDGQQWINYIAISRGKVKEQAPNDLAYKDKMDKCPHCNDSGWIVVEGQPELERCQCQGG